MNSALVITTPDGKDIQVPAGDFVDQAKFMIAKQVPVPVLIKIFKHSMKCFGPKQLNHLLELVLEAAKSQVTFDYSLENLREEVKLFCQLILKKGKPMDINVLLSNQRLAEIEDAYHENGDYDVEQLEAVIAIACQEAYDQAS